MKTAIAFISKVILTVVLIPVTILFLYLFLLLCVTLIPVAVLRLLLLNLTEIIRASFSGHEYEAHFQERTRNHFHHFVRMLIDIIQLPFIPWTGKEKSIGHAHEYFEFERFIWIKMWYVAIPLALITIYGLQLSYAGAREISQNFGSYLMKKQEEEIDELKQEVVNLQDSLNRLPFQRIDSLNQKIEAMKVENEYLNNLIEKSQLDSLAVEENDALSMLAQSQKVKLSESQINTQASNSEEQRRNVNVTQQNNLFPKESIVSYSKNGFLCVLSESECGMLDGTLSINSLPVGKRKFWNSNNSKLCGDKGTYFNELEPGSYRIMFEHQKGRFIKSITLSRGDTTKVYITCNN